MIAAFTGAAFAATPTFNMVGTFDYFVEYNAMDKTWDYTTSDETGQADNKLSTIRDWERPFKLEASVATSGNPNLGTVTLTLVKSGKVDNIHPNITLTGALGGGTLKLGQVDTVWKNMYQKDGRGAYFTKSFGKVTVDAFTNDKEVDGKYGNIGNGLMLGGSVTDKTSAFVGTIMDTNQKKATGVAFAGGSTKVGSLDLLANVATEINQDPGAAWMVKGVIPAGTAKLTAYVTALPANFGQFISPDDWRGPGRETWAWYKNNGKAYNSKPNVFVKAEVPVIKDLSNGYAEFDYNANETYTAKIGANYKPLFLDDASFKVDQAGTSWVDAKFTKNFAGNLTARFGAGAKVAGDVTTPGAGVAVSKKFDWLTTWASVAKNYNTKLYPTWDNWDFGLNDGGKDKLVVKMGAQAIVQF